MGQGRQSTKRARARAAGDLETADRLAPPSERKLSEDQRCGALTGSGTPCRNMKGSSTDHPGYGNCSKHGGNTEAGVKSAMREMGRDLINTYKREHLRFGGDRNDPSIASITPEQALLEEVRRSVALVRFLEERIAQWNLSPVGEATLENFVRSRDRAARLNPQQKHEVASFLDSIAANDQDSPYYLPSLTTEPNSRTGMTSFTDAREWLYLYREERAHAARVAKMALDAGVAQRLVSIAEDQGRILASALRVVLQALNLSPDQQALVPHVVPKVLRAVATDSPIPDITSLTTPAEAV